MLYDREDRMSRPMFLREYDIEGSTEKRARAEGLPWPPSVVMGGRVCYSRRLVASWFEQQAGVHQAQAVEARQERTRVVEDALAAVLAEIIATVQLSDEARERITELLGGGGANAG
jgi:hypothetical protein